ncbi:hypothetical protein FOZ62_017978, partial [Perkinsus olseni]
MNSDIRRSMMISSGDPAKGGEARRLLQRVRELSRQFKVQDRKKENTELMGRLWATLKDCLVFNYGSLDEAVSKLPGSGKKSPSMVASTDLHRILWNVGIQLNGRVVRSIFYSASNGEREITMQTFKTILIANALGTISSGLKTLEANRRRAKAWCGVFIEIMLNACPKNEAFLVQTFNDKISQNLVIHQLRPMLAGMILKQGKDRSTNGVPCCLSYSTFSTACRKLAIFRKHEEPLLRGVFSLARGSTVRCSICGMSISNSSSITTVEDKAHNISTKVTRVDFMRLLTCLTLLTSMDTDKDDKLRMLVDVHDDDEDRCLYVRQLYSLVKNATSLAACVQRLCAGAAGAGGSDAITDGDDLVIAELDRQQCNRVFVALMRHLTRSTATDFFSFEGQQCLDGLPYNIYALVNSEELLAGLKVSTNDDYSQSLLDHLIPGAVSMKWLISRDTPYATIMRRINVRHVMQKRRKTMRHRLQGLAKLNRTKSYRVDLYYIRRGLQQLGLIPGEMDTTSSSSCHQNCPSPSTSTTDSAIDSDSDWSQFEAAFRESREVEESHLQKFTDKHDENMSTIDREWKPGGGHALSQASPHSVGHTEVGMNVPTLRDLSSITGLQMLTKLGREQTALVADDDIGKGKPSEDATTGDNGMILTESPSAVLTQEGGGGAAPSSPTFYSDKWQQAGRRLSSARFRSTYSTKLSQSLRKHESSAEVKGKHNPRGRRKSDVTILMELLRPLDDDDDDDEEPPEQGEDEVARQLPDEVFQQPDKLLPAAPAEKLGGGRRRRSRMGKWFRNVPGEGLLICAKSATLATQSETTLVIHELTRSMEVAIHGTHVHHGSVVFAVRRSPD